MTVAPALLSSRTSIITSSKNRNRPGGVIVLNQHHQQGQGASPSFDASSSNKVSTSCLVVFKKVLDTDQVVESKTAGFASPCLGTTTASSSSTILCSSSSSSSSEDCLQSADKRRRYMRRGSKTSLMMRGTCCAFMMELQHPKWRQKGTFLTRKSSVVELPTSGARTTKNKNRLWSSSTMDDDDAVASLASSCGESEDSFGSTTSSPIIAKTKSIHDDTQIVASSPRLADLLELGRANEEARKCLPLFNRPLKAMLNQRRLSTVSLVTSALELSYIDDEDDRYMEL